ncbi:hypothetical protein ACP43V_01625 [Vibrio genomosp. F10 str. 9ZC157]|uniref:Uncharacterized protein n=1 Tax=Vibrio genomosp. F10 str. ZF-129 TaxID=1187848 RepID=A0A1E5BCM9_9VIBR|nr:hypothetical protein [Vibrio genomosp. F10]OEE32331.1 hypothetical protein A1QO_11465 [Vibrio genomosp. F10 str. ZF-129]OEE98129.1 hypothetical protein A1QM_12945 [Vibrio genomosp. F10 str. 9ZC157]
MYETNDVENNATLFVDAQAGLKYLDWWIDVRKECSNNSQSIVSIEYTKGSTVSMLSNCYGDGYTLTPILDLEKRSFLEELKQSTHFMNFGFLVFDIEQYGAWLSKRKETESELVALYRSIESGQTRYSELKNKDIYERGWMDAHKENKRNLSSLKNQHAKQVSEIEADLEHQFNKRMVNFKANSDFDL